ncbi:AMP nucleosidase [Tepidimonas sediminis]|uniref:AMP nucleosidase n=1 Tax=Tepidimonas sediminis TaxID=2588941 RepID=A0A554WIN4_9BURK|nr:AMP nucleosidase [Tepidimonas sediminis]TSE23433.1 AMP nucleosidase [Tepidimonas sediminis]
MTTPVHTPAFVAPQRFTDPDAAVAHAARLYEAAVQHLRAALHDYLRQPLQADTALPRVRACYPAVRLHVPRPLDPLAARARQSHGFVTRTGRYETTLTRPDLFADYWREQFALLLQHHGEPLEIAISHEPIPLHFALGEDSAFEGELSAVQRARLGEVFDLPDLSAMDDAIANGLHVARDDAPQPLALFRAARIDYSLARLRHYGGTSPAWFQNFVLFTNYAFYVDEFVRLGRAQMQRPDSEYVAFVEPGNVVTWRAGLGAGERARLAGPEGSAPPRMPQMPAYHLVRADRSGITLVNIGVGPSNAKTATDHIAVLRPHAWLMLGHCAGLRHSQQLGDYVLAHAYVREDHVLDEELPLWVPIPALAEVQQALEGAVADVTGLQGAALKRVLRTGTVASTDNRNWELLPGAVAQRRLSLSRAIALDMESATIAANGFRFRVPYGTLLCVSDKPLHGAIKLPGMADRFYRERVDQHLRIGLRAVERLRAAGIDQLHSRKLRSFDEVAFQ